MFGQSKEEKNKDVVRRYFEEGSKNTDVFNEVLSRDYVYHSPDVPQPILGVEGLKEYYSAYNKAFPDLMLTVNDLICEGDMCAVRYTIKGAHKGDFQGIKATGKNIVITGVNLLRLEDEKIVEEWEHFDSLGLLQQLGAIPTPAGISR